MNARTDVNDDETLIRKLQTPSLHTTTEERQNRRYHTDTVPLKNARRDADADDSTLSLSQHDESNRDISITKGVERFNGLMKTATVGRP